MIIVNDNNSNNNLIIIIIIIITYPYFLSHQRNQHLFVLACCGLRQVVNYDVPKNSKVGATPRTKTGLLICYVCNVSLILF